MTGIKSRMNSNFGQIGRLPTELGVLERLNISHRLIMGNHHGSSAHMLVTRAAD